MLDANLKTQLQAYLTKIVHPIELGDVTTVSDKQIVIAVGQGSTASLSAFDYLIRMLDDTMVEEALAA